MRGFLVKLKNYTDDKNYIEANYLIVTENALTLNERVKALIAKTSLKFLAAQEIDINNPNVVLLSEDSSKV